jgi:hypothetical protein
MKYTLFRAKRILISKNFESTSGWIASIFALAGQITIIFKNPTAFLLWTVGEGILLFLALRRKSWGEVVFFTLYVLTNIVAYLKW